MLEPKRRSGGMMSLQHAVDIDRLATEITGLLVRLGDLAGEAWGDEAEKKMSKVLDALHKQGVIVHAHGMLAATRQLRQLKLFKEDDLNKVLHAPVDAATESAA